MSQENENGKKTFLAGEALEAYRRVKLSAGEVVYADADAMGLGITMRAAADGEQVTVKLWNHQGTRKVTAKSSFSAGATLYAADDGKVDDSPSSGAAICQALEAATADGDIIEAVCLLESEGGSELEGASIEDSGVEGTSSTTEDEFDQKVTIAAGDLQEGDVLHIRAAFKAPATHDTDTFNFKLYVGTELIKATGAVNLANDEIAYIDAMVTVRAAGASGKLAGSGVYGIGAEGTATAKPFIKEEAAEDLSVAVDVKATVTVSVSDVGNEAILKDLVVVRHRA